MKKFSVINQRFNFNHLQGFPSINEEIINKHNYSFHNTNNKIDFEKTDSESLIADISPVEHEIIAKLMIELLISLTITRAEIREIEEKLGVHCFNFTKKILNDYNKVLYIDYDSDDLDESKISWNSIPCPINNPIERNASSLIKTSDNNKIQLTINIPEKSDSLQSNSRTNTITKTLILRNSVEVTKVEGSIEQKDKKNKIKELPIDPAFDVEEVNDTNKIILDEKEIGPLREQIEKELEIKRLEELKLKKLNKQKNSSYPSLTTGNGNNKKNAKPFDTKKFTFDSDGNVITYKKKQPELITDFSVLNTIIKEKKEIIERNQKKKRTKILSPLSQEKIVRKPTISVKKLPQIIHNPNVQYTKPMTIQIGKESIEPSGNNFDLIIPTTGVVIKNENNKKKSGDFDFKKTFNKYSINDYNKILTENISIQNLNSLKSKMTFTSTNNYTAYISSNNDNPITYSDVFTHKQLLTDRAFRRNPLLSSSLSSGNMIKVSPTMNSLNLKSKIELLDIKTDKLDEYYSTMSTSNAKQENLFKQFNTITSSSNLTKSTISQKQINDYDEINNFAKKIITYQGWGGKVVNQGKQNFFRKPAKGNLSQEVDQNIIGFIPRLRKYHHRVKSQV